MLFASFYTLPSPTLQMMSEEPQLHHLPSFCLRTLLLFPVLCNCFLRVTTHTSGVVLLLPWVLLAQELVFRYVIYLFFMNRRLCPDRLIQDAVEILEPMTKDSVDFVRQGAFIALGMILVEQSEASSPSMASTRALYHKIIGDKHEDPVARFGATLGQGLIDAGGRNVTINLQSRAGSRNTSAIVGMVLFCQFWYWYPLAHCASLAFQPTGIIGIDGNLDVSLILQIHD